MGIDARAYSRALPQDGARRVSGQAALKLIEDRARAWADWSGFGPLLSTAGNDSGTLYVYLAPFCNPVVFEAFAGLEIRFRSSADGPGFHATAIALADHLAQALNLHWDWGPAADGSWDDTGYARSRDVDELKRRMATHLRDIMRRVAALDDPVGTSVDIQSSLGLDLGDGQIAGPLGPIPLSLVRRLADSDEEFLLAYAEDYFPWWSTQPDKLFWNNMLRGLLWQSAEWRLAANHQEGQVESAVFHAADELRQFGPLAPELADALDEYWTVIQTDVPPSPIGIGYRRRLVAYTPFEHWTVLIPGYLTEANIEEDDTVVLFYHSTLTVRLSSFTATKGVPEEPTAGGALIREKDPSEHHDDGWTTQSARVELEKTDKIHTLIITLAVEDKRKVGILDAILEHVTYRGDA